MPIRRLLSLFEPAEQAPANPFAEALAGHLDRFPPERLEYLAGFAGQLTRVAWADEEVSEVERERIQGILAESSNLEASEADVVIDLLRGQLENLRGTEDYQLNRAVNAHADLEERENLIDCLFAVAAADGTVSNVEDQEIRKIGHALEIPNERLMDIRGRYRAQLEILRVAAAVRDRGTPDT